MEGDDERWNAAVREYREMADVMRLDATSSADMQRARRFYPIILGCPQLAEGAANTRPTLLARLVRRFTRAKDEEI